MHAIRAECIDCNRKRQCGVNPARKSHYDPWEAMFIDVVADSQHQRAVDAGFVTQFGRNVPRQGHHCGAATALEIDVVRTLLEGRRTHHDVAFRIHDERVAVEYQLVLSTHHVDVHDG